MDASDIELPFNSCHQGFGCDMCQEVTLSEIRTVLAICQQKSNPLVIVVALNWKMRTESYADS